MYFVVLILNFLKVLELFFFMSYWIVCGVGVDFIVIVNCRLLLLFFLYFFKKILGIFSNVNKVLDKVNFKLDMINVSYNKLRLNVLI